jgi:hypothetical protein
VYVAFGVQVLQASERLAEDEGYEPLLLEAFGELRFHEVEAGAPGHVGHDDPEVVAYQEGAVGAEEVGVIRQDHGLDLLRGIVLHTGTASKQEDVSDPSVLLELRGESIDLIGARTYHVGV